MKNNYRKLKFSISLQTTFVAALTVLVGTFLLDYVIDGIYNQSFGKMFVSFMTAFHVEESTAIRWYWKYIGHNKDVFILLGFILLFAFFFYIALTRMLKYLEQIELGINNIISDSKEPVHMITELKPIEERLNEIKETLNERKMEAIEAENRKNDLLLFLAHDLKTPLTSIVAYLSMLDTQPEMSVEERARYTHISLEKAERLGELINEFFEITKLNLQNNELEKTELNLSMMLEQLADELYGVLREKNLICKVYTEENLVIKGDPDKLARVFDNILRNAIAYCYPDTLIEIQAKEKEGRIEIIFSNRGEQIPREKIGRLFDKFYRVDDARSSATGGAGLGLAIAKDIVELHGGTIRANSDREQTKFIVSLPKGEEDEIHSYSRHTFGGGARRRKKI